ncbi:S8 family serine peptidase [Saccharothrix isguenensis]
MVAVVASALVVTPAQAAEGEIRHAGRQNTVADSYIVVLKDAGQTDAVAAKVDARVTHRYTAALNGFAASMNEKAAKKLAADPAVEFVAQNQKFKATGDQVNPPWGLDRLSQRDLPLNRHYSYTTTASNVHAYVIDTGIRTTHTDFGGRATFDVNTSGDGYNVDCGGHGTHVAGTIGGELYGVAKGVKLHAVKVLDCDGWGTTAGVAAGIDWVTANAQKPAVANMSLGGAPDDIVDAATRRSIASGITYTIASGNESDNACYVSPARVAEAITVNAADRNDARAWFSNWGTCTDMYAPGLDILSAWHSSDTAVETISGTSMAAPHVAGAVAMYLATNPTASAAQVQAALKGVSTPNRVTDAGAGSPNLTLFTGNAVADTLARGESLTAGKSKSSQDGRYRLTMQTDGNLVLYTAAGQPLWHTRSNGSGATHATLQTDGNFVVYTAAGVPVWHSRTDRTAGDRVMVQNDSNVVLYGPQGQYFWHRHLG